MKRLAVCYLLSLAISTPAAPQASQPVQAAQAASDPQAVALLQRSLAVQTGAASLTDVMLSASATRIAGSEGETGTATFKAIASGGSRMDLNLVSGRLSEARTPLGGPPGGAWSGPDAKVHPMAAHNQWTPSAWFFPAFTEGQILSTSAYTATYVGAETRNGEAVQHVRVCIPASGTADAVSTLIQHLSQVDIYLDASTLLPVAVAYSIHPDKDAGLDIPVEIRFSDFRTVNNVAVPFRVQQYIQFGLALDIQVQSVAFNSGLTAPGLSLP